MNEPVIAMGERALKRAAPCLWMISICLLFSASVLHADEYESQRRGMVDAIFDTVEETSRYLGKAHLDDRVMAAMLKVPRHRFVPDNLQNHSYENRPLPIGHGQTISQPYIVALMTDLLELQPDDVVLEIGTGSGYQAAILAEMVSQVHSLEIIEALGQSASRRLAGLGYPNVDVRIADGYYGLESAAPFDAIVVTAAASHVPPPLVRQLKPGAILAIPVGSKFQIQHLTLVRKQSDGSVVTRQVLPVRFVPLTGDH